ncbi:BTB/POZ domain-containing protein 9-like [Drosophila pseudoobscura]|uniref:BTB/POZ domain-containing protein 9-like n=1 Tax=Drosophila pseudoobscura pseudoobscura TaxID=46245 RepID=A0A6I8UXV2_DROPS|nr:BTB/POZ domain-containing protein 9 [Drosophila pseudoobscura]
MNSQASHGSSTSSSAAKRRHSAGHEPVHEFGEQVWADLNSLCMDEHFSDVSFIVEDQRLPAHRIILGKRSNYFRDLLCGDTAECEGQIGVDSLEAFKIVLGYLYSGTLPISTLDQECHHPSSRPGQSVWFAGSRVGNSQTPGGESGRQQRFHNPESYS